MTIKAAKSKKRKPRAANPVKGRKATKGKARKGFDLNHWRAKPVEGFSIVTKQADADRGKPVLIAGRTLAEIARGSGMTASYMSRVHLRRRTLSLAQFVKVSRVLGMTLDQTFQVFPGKLALTAQHAPEVEALDSLGGGSVQPATEVA